ncbi:unnamed protein product [Angiostrongylus costaricensis]|uniref:DB domain-containing protein n=1 Tax=Angiostrongylus costaricensis TaxID=334426 RepID=A0A0R3PXP7_ANGCS|nr:unnamed protein product [Angiostrongylus costaricensis]
MHIWALQLPTVAHLCIEPVLLSSQTGRAPICRPRWDGRIAEPWARGSIQCVLQGCAAIICTRHHKQIQIIFGFLTNVCPGPQLGYAFDCASSKVNHSKCCERAGIQNFLAGRCMPFCRAHTAQPANPLQFLPCLQVFEPIKNCYRDYKSTHSNFIED